MSVFFDDGNKGFSFKDVLFIAFFLFIVPAIGWFVGWILRLSFGGFSGGWSLGLSLVGGFLLSAFVPPILSIPAAIGFFFGVKQRL